MFGYLNYNYFPLSNIEGEWLRICSLNKCPETTITNGWIPGDERLKKPLLWFVLGLYQNKVGRAY